MKDCEKITGFIAFDDFQELDAWFKKLADENEEELSDNLCVEGNSGLLFRNVKQWINYFGIKNVYFEKSGFEHGCLEEFYFDLKKADHNGNFFLDKADEISIKDGLLRLWYD